MVRDCELYAGSNEYEAKMTESLKKAEIPLR
jgi:hypothetical protein